MSSTELVHLELLAEIDALVERMQRWTQTAPPWPPADQCRAVAGRLLARIGNLRTRLDAPLVIATLGGTGTGKSELVNALAGAAVVRPGRDRPTTLCPTMVCRPGLRPELLGIDRSEVEVVERDLPALAQLVLIDCPDPDTSERPESPDATSPLARLRRIVPFCDVLLVTTTQQKYRSARVAEELAAAAPGARTVFVQTHADQDSDIRDDWRRVLGNNHAREHIYFVDSCQAQALALQGLGPQGEFAGLTDLLLRQYAGAAASRIRRANFLDLASAALANCRSRLDAAMPAVEKVQAAIADERNQLAGLLARRVVGDLRGNRRPWESRLLEQVTARWGLSPFALVLRLYQGIGSLATMALLYRARTPAQLALWGMVEGARTWQRHRQARRPLDKVAQSAAGGWDAGELRRASTIVEGYAIEAQLGPAGNAAATSAAAAPSLDAQAEQASWDFATGLAHDLDGVVSRQAQRSSGFITRMTYELLLLAMLGFVLFRLGKNFFYDSWLAANVTPIWGVESYAAAAFWLALWCLLLVWLFTSRLRRGLSRAIDELATNWSGLGMAGAVFAPLEAECRKAELFRTSLVQVQAELLRIRDGMT